jgi:hypothetical protein
LSQKPPVSRYSASFSLPALVGRVWEHLTDARIKIVKAALQLTPDQEKLWPPIEEAIRARAKDRQAYIATAADRARELRGRSPIEVLRDRNPIEFMKKCGDRLATLGRPEGARRCVGTALSDPRPRSEAWMAFLALFALRELRDAADERRVRSDDDNDDD